MKEASVDERILETATRLFYTQGYNLTGINQIIDEAAIAKASLYNKYQSKTDLLLAYLDGQATTFYSELDAFLHPRKSARDKLLGIFEYHIQIYLKADFGGCPFLKIKDELPPAEAAVWNRVRENKSRLRGLFSQLVAKLDHKTGLADEALADMLFFILEGSTVSASVHKNIDDIQSALATVQKLI